MYCVTYSIYVLYYVVYYNYITYNYRNVFYQEYIGLQKWLWVLGCIYIIISCTDISDSNNIIDNRKQQMV